MVEEAGDILQDFEVRLVVKLRQIGVPDSQAEITASELIAGLRKDYAGVEPYIPETNRRERNRQIIEAWKAQRALGREDRHAIAAAHHVHKRTVDRVIARYLNQQYAKDTDLGRRGWAL